MPKAGKRAASPAKVSGEALPTSPEPVVEHPPYTCSCVQVPCKRRVEMASVAVVVSLIAVYFVLTALALWFDFLYFRVVFLALVAWQILLDRSPETRGGRPVSWVRRIPLFQHVIDYFPIEMVVEEPLDASKPHIIAAHPHG